MKLLLAPAGFPVATKEVVRKCSPARAHLSIATAPRPARGSRLAVARAGLRRCFLRMAGLLAGCLFLLALAQNAHAYDPALVHLMSNAEIFGTLGFEGDVDVNASGQWIAASRKGVFLSDPNDPHVWQQVFYGFRRYDGD